MSKETIVELIEKQADGVQVPVVAYLRPDSHGNPLWTDDCTVGYSGSHPKAPRPNPDIDWPDVLHYCSMVAALLCVIAGVTALLVDYLISR